MAYKELHEKAVRAAEITRDETLSPQQQLVLIEALLTEYDEFLRRVFASALKIELERDPSESYNDKKL